MQADEAALRAQEAVLDAPRRNASWEVVDFEVAKGVDPRCAQNLRAITAVPFFCQRPTPL